MSRPWLVIGLIGLAAVVAALVASLALAGDDDGDGDDVVAGDLAVSVSVRSGDAVREACLLLADTEEERQRGLMEVTDLEGHDGMLFEFESEEPRGFWMRNTPMPLSIAFYDRDRRFVSAHDMEPCGDSPDCPTTSSAAPAQYAVEVPRGRLASLGLVEGSELRPLDEACRP